MKEIKVLFGQTLLDIAIQELGDSSRAFELAVINGLSVTEELAADLVVLVPDASSEVTSIVNIFKDKANAPASADISGAVITKDEGIDFWAIEKDFEIQ